jgi:hypothetical protein
VDITGKLQDVGIILNNNTFESTLEQVTTTGIPVVEPSGVGDTKSLHGF